MQTGQQIGLMNIGGNSGNQGDSLLKSRNAEQILDEMLVNHEMSYECKVLKKVIKSEDESGKIERIEFNSDPKVVKKFIKRHSKCKQKKDRAPKIGLRQKILNTQLQNESKTPNAATSVNDDQEPKVEQNENVIQISMDAETNTKAAQSSRRTPAGSQFRGAGSTSQSRRGTKQRVDLKNLSGGNIDELLQNSQNTGVINLGDITTSKNKKSRASASKKSMSVAK